MTDIFVNDFLTRSNKRVKTLPSQSDMQEAAHIESMLFGKEGDLDELGHEGADDISFEEMIKRGASGVSDVLNDMSGEVAEKRVPVWEDPADTHVVVDVATKSRSRKLRREETEETLKGEEYVKRLRAEHQRLNPRTVWAELPTERRARRKRLHAKLRREGGVGEDDDEDFYEEEEEEAAGRVGRSAGPLVEKSSSGGRLPSGELQVSRLKDANQSEPSKAVVRSVQFHPNASLFLTAGLDKSLRLFQVDGANNPKVQSVFLEDLPIYRAAFSSNGQSVVATGRRKFFYIYHLQAARVERVHGVVGRSEKSFESFCESVCPTSAPLLAFYGNEGHIPIVSLNSRQPVATLKMNGSVRCAAFSSDGTQLLSSGSDGTMYVWDLRTHRCLNRCVDDGALSTSSLACSPNGKLAATSSASGVVNLYNYRNLLERSSSKFLPAKPAPVRSLMNLTTDVDNLLFNADSQIMAMSSRMTKDALRLVHLPSATVFSNWPTSKTPMHCVTSMAFSPGGGYFAIGNAKGRALLYRLHHYTNA